MAIVALPPRFGPFQITIAALSAILFAGSPCHITFGCLDGRNPGLSFFSFPRLKAPLSEAKEVSPPLSFSLFLVAPRQARASFDPNDSFLPLVLLRFLSKLALDFPPWNHPRFLDVDCGQERCSNQRVSLSFLPCPWRFSSRDLSRRPCPLIGENRSQRLACRNLQLFPFFCKSPPFF